MKKQENMIHSLGGKSMETDSKIIRVLKAAMTTFLNEIMKNMLTMIKSKNSRTGKYNIIQQ